MSLQSLYANIESRQHESPKQSYTAALCAGGLDSIAKKIGEETAEMLVAATRLSSRVEQEQQDHAQERKAFVNELADTMYHQLVLMAYLGVSLEDVETELTRRSAVSGLEEKRNRKSL